MPFSPITPPGFSGTSQPPPWEKEGNMAPQGPPLPPDDPWVVALSKLFPMVPLGEIMMFAGKFRDNMFQALNNQIKKDLARARETARKFRESINE